MRIVKVELHEVENTLLRPFQSSAQATRVLRHVLVRVEDERGAVGWGEASCLPDPHYMPETAETVWHILRDFLVPRVVGRTWSTIEELVALYEPVKGNEIAKSGLEVACWDLLGRATEKSVAALLGGTRATIASGVSLGIEPEIERLLDAVRRHLDEGYRRVKLKIGPGADVDVVRRVREALPDAVLMVDANAAYRVADAAHLRQLDAFGLTMIEQPLGYGDLLGHAELARAIVTPICLDESLRSLDETRTALALGSCSVVNVKIARLGGLLEARRVHDLCLARGVPVWCGGMHDFGVGRAANVALASLPGFTVPGDVSGFDKYFERDVVDPPIVARRGEVSVPTDRPGLGHDVVDDEVARRTVRSFAARAA